MSTHFYHPRSPYTASPTAADMPRLVLTDAILHHLDNNEPDMARPLLEELTRHRPAHAHLLNRLMPT